MKKQNIRHRNSNTETSKVMVSIVLPVYNAAATISFAIKSILAQQYVNWELLVMNDGSTDSTPEIVSSFKDNRIRTISCEHNFIATLNRGFSEAKGKYIARMDADDLMAPERLQIQVSIMEKRKDIDICGSWMETFGDGLPHKIAGNIYGKVEKPAIKLLHENFIFHPTVMIRRSFWKNQNLQYKNYKYAEDYQLWFEMAKLGAGFYIEAQPLLFYRISKEQASNSHRAEQEKTSQRIRWEIIEYIIGIIEDKETILKLYELQRSLVERGVLPERIVIQQFLLLINSLKI